MSARQQPCHDGGGRPPRYRHVAMGMPAGAILVAVTLTVGCTKYATVEGTVSSIKGEPIEDVVIIAATSTNIKEEMPFAKLETKTNSKGKFTLQTTLAGRTYMVNYQHPKFFSSFGRAMRAIKFPELEKTQVEEPVRLSPIPGIAGKILACVTGKPIGGARLSLKNGKDAKASPQTARSANDGRFTFDNLAEHSSAITVDFGGHQQEFSFNLRPTDSSPGERLELEPFFLCRRASAAAGGPMMFREPFDLQPGSFRPANMIEQWQYQGWCTTCWPPNRDRGYKLSKNDVEGFGRLRRFPPEQVDRNVVRVKRGDRLLFPSGSFFQCQLVRHPAHNLTFYTGSAEVPEGYYMGVTSLTDGQLIQTTETFGPWTNEVPPEYNVKCVDFLRLENAVGVPGYHLATVTGTAGYHALVSYACDPNWDGCRLSGQPYVFRVQ